MSTESTCRHCGRTISESTAAPGWWSHVIGPGSLLRRCDPNETGQPYGLEAEPVQ